MLPKSLYILYDILLHIFIYLLFFTHLFIYTCQFRDNEAVRVYDLSSALSSRTLQA